MTDEVKLILKIATEETGLTVEQITSKSRKVPLVNARRMIAVILKRHTKMKLWQIGEVVGGMDHACVIHYLNTHNDLMETEYEFRKRFVKMESRFTRDRNTVETKLEMKIKERDEINKEISRLRKRLKIKHS